MKSLAAKVCWFIAKGESTSDLVRTALEAYLGIDDEEARPTGGPQSLTLVERGILAAQHQTLALQYEEGEWEREEHEKIVEVLERGFTGEYDVVFGSLSPELPRRECRLLWDILDMFRVLQPSFTHLDDAERDEIGEYAEHALSFQGFDGNDEREARLMHYGAFLVRNGRWEEQQQPVFDQDGGNSHSPMLGSYERMLAAFQPMYDRRASDYSVPMQDRLHLSTEALKEVYTAWPHPGSPAAWRARGE